MPVLNFILSVIPMNTPVITTLIFDLDGTLLDTLQDLADSTNYALSLQGLPTRTLDEIRRFVGNGVRKLIERAVPDGENNPCFAATFASFKEHYVYNCRNKTALYPGIAQLLKQLCSQGYKLAIVSNKLQSGVDELYQSYFTDCVQVAIGECPEVQPKPAPDMVYAALEALDSNRREAVYIGDSEVDIETARNAGLPCISVLWGFRDRDFLIRHGATRLADSPERIKDLLKTL